MFSSSTMSFLGAAHFLHLEVNSEKSVLINSHYMLLGAYGLLFLIIAYNYITCDCSIRVTALLG